MNRYHGLYLSMLLAVTMGNAGAQNLLVNPGFQDGALAPWVAGSAPTSGDFALGTPDAPWPWGWWSSPFGYSGPAGTPAEPLPNESYWIYAPISGFVDCWISQEVAVDAGTEYMFSGMVAGSGRGGADLWVYQGTGWSGFVQSPPTGTTDSSGAVRIATHIYGFDWDRLYGYFTAETGTVTVIFRTYSTTQGQSTAGHHADQFSLRPRPAPAFATVSDDMNGTWIWWDPRNDSGMSGRMTPAMDEDAPWWNWSGVWVNGQWDGAWRYQHLVGGVADDPDGYYLNVGGARNWTEQRGSLGGVVRDFTNLAPGTWKIVLWANDNHAVAIDDHVVYICAKVNGGGHRDDYLDAQTYAIAQSADGKDWGNGWIKIDSTDDTHPGNVNGAMTFTIASPDDYLRLWTYSEVYDLNRKDLYSLDYVQVVPVSVAFDDLDGDGIADEYERFEPGPGETTIYLDDSDRDGLFDGEEDANRNGMRDGNETNARAADSDGDGWSDGVEVNVLGSDPLNNAAPGAVADADTDRLPDSVDPDDTTVDTDGDGFRDWYEAAHPSGDPDSAAVVPNLGDANADGAVSNIDALITQAFFIGNIDAGNAVWQGTGFRHTDPSGDGFASNIDALMMQSFFIGNLPLLPLQ